MSRNGCGEQGAVLDDADAPRLLDDEEAGGVAGRRRHVDGLVERRRELLERDRRRRRGGAAARPRRCGAGVAPCWRRPACSDTAQDARRRPTSTTAAAMMATKRRMDGGHSARGGARNPGCRDGLARRRPASAAERLRGRPRGRRRRSPPRLRRPARAASVSSCSWTSSRTPSTLLHGHDAADAAGEQDAVVRAQVGDARPRLHDGDAGAGGQLLDLGAQHAGQDVALGRRRDEAAGAHDEHVGRRALEDPALAVHEQRVVHAGGARRPLGEGGLHHRHRLVLGADAHAAVGDDAQRPLREVAPVGLDEQGRAAVRRPRP